MPLAIITTTIARRALDLVLLGLIVVFLATLLLTRIAPAITGAPVFVVGGGSMEPAIHLGSVVVDLPVATSDLSVGDVVSIRVGPQQAVFTHRITRLIVRDGAAWIETRGDANPVVDPSIVPASTVLGRVALVVPGLGYLVQLLGSFAGIAFVLSLAMVTLLVTWLLEGHEEERRMAPCGPAVPADGPAMAAEAVADRGGAG
jgi:signal peptidase I